MIDFLTVEGNEIVMWADDHYVGQSANPEKLAEMIVKKGGLANAVYRSSDWIEHPNCEEFDFVWYRVCKLV